MTEDRYLELAPLAALGVLDGDDRAGFDQHLPGCLVCRAELAAHASLVSLIPLGLQPVAPHQRLRQRLLGEREAGANPPVRLALAVAAAAVIALGVGLLIVKGQRDAARSDAETARAQAATAVQELEAVRASLGAARTQITEAAAFRTLVASPRTRVVSLAGLPPAPGARGRVVFDPESREAVLLASGLAAAPAGQAYEAWVIAGGAPIAAGVFWPDADGRVVFRLPDVAETARVKTFAVTLEPEAGVSAPTGPMVLAGAVS